MAREIEPHEEELLWNSDVNYGGIESQSSMNYSGHFGKTYTGETLKVLFTILSKEGSHTLNNMKFKVVLKRGKNMENSSNSQS